MPCYGVLFGPQLYGHGTRVESHTSFGRVENKYPFGPNVERLNCMIIKTLNLLFNFFSFIDPSWTRNLKCTISTMKDVVERFVAVRLLYIY